MPAPTSDPEATRTPCATCSRSGKSPLPRAELLVGQWATEAPRVREERQLALGRVHVVGEHGAGPDKTVTVVGVDVVLGLGEERCDGSHLRRVLVDVRGEARAGDVLHDRPAGVQQVVGGRVREARCHGIPRAAAAVPAAGQRGRLLVGALGGAEQCRGKRAVADDEARRDAEADPGRLREQRLDRRREVRAEDERGRGSGRHETLHELRRNVHGVARVGEPGLLRQGAAVEPFEQRHPEGADDSNLGVVDVRVDEAGQQDATTEVDDRLVAVAGCDVGVGTAFPDDAAPDQQPGVLVRAEPDARRLGAPRRVEHGGPVERHEVSSFFWCSLERARPARAATLTAMVDGSLPRMPGRPIGDVIRAMVSAECPSAARSFSKRLHFADEPMSPMGPRRSGAQGHVAERGVLGVVVGHDEHVAARRHQTQHHLWNRRMVHVDAGDGVVETDQPTRLDRVAARVDEMQLEVVAGQDAGELEPDVADPEDRHGGHHGQRFEEQLDVAPAALAPVGGVGLVAEPYRHRLGCDRVRPRASAGRAREPWPRGCRRRPCPSCRAAETTILVPASRGACPRTLATVTRTPASRSVRRRSTARNQFTAAPQPARCSRSTGRPACRPAAARPWRRVPTPAASQEPSRRAGPGRRRGRRCSPRARPRRGSRT